MTDSPFTTRQRELARHALGLPNKTNKSYRNCFITGEGSVDWARWNDMWAKGLAHVRRDVAIFVGDDQFWLSREGAEAALNPGETLCPEDFPPAESGERPHGP